MESKDTDQVEENKQAQEAQDDNDDDYDDEMDDVGELSSTPAAAQALPPQASGAKLPPASGLGPGQTMYQGGKFDPLPWDQFFDTQEMIDTEAGGQIPVYTAGDGSGHVFLCLHGAGHSALSFAALAKHLKVNSTCISFDFRGHGANTQTDPLVLDKENLINDTLCVVKHIATKLPEQSIILVGHSMGGSIAVKAAHAIQNSFKEEAWAKHVVGAFVIDVVEGSAMDALPFMEDIVLKRPKKFQSVQAVVQYGIQSGSVRDLASARVSMPGQVEEKTDAVTNLKYYAWRTDLMATKPYWVSWFKDLTQEFLDLRVPKQLLLAGSDRMDKELTIAQMEGKFKMVVVNNVGHAVQEDDPAKVAEVFMDFLEKFHIPTKFADKLVVTSISGKKVVIGQPLSEQPPE